MSKRTFQQIPGYIIGGSVFLILIPSGLFRLSRSFDHLVGLRLIPSPSLRIAVAVVLLLLGLTFAFWSLVIQNTIGKGGPLEGAGIEVSPKTRNLVVTGPYRYSRNPMLFGTCVFYFAVAVYLDSIIALAVAALFMAFMLFFVKLTEEPRLLREFGKEYAEYRRKVPMFVPWAQKNWIRKSR
jgi:protein-S-isoprenylcysteine O-methyltransferase Ste14